MAHITAAQATEMTANGPSVDIAEWIDWLDGRIERAARAGESVISDPFSGVRMVVTADQRRLVREHYLAHGFECRDASCCFIRWRRHLSVPVK